MSVAQLRPQILPRETFETFSISESALSGIGRAQLLDDHEDLAEAVQSATMRVPHKAKFMVRQTNMLTGAVMLKFYAVKKKSVPNYRYHEYQTRAVHDRYAEHLFDLDAACVGEGL